MSRPHAILFDWDNTLVDSWDCIQAAYNGTFRHFGMREWSRAEIERNVAKSLKDSFPDMFGENWIEARDVFTRTFEAIHLDYLRPLPGIEDMLRRLHQEGLYLAVVSNKRGTFLRTEARALGWDIWFGALVGASDAAADKPAVDPVTLALAPRIFNPRCKSGLSAICLSICIAPSIPVVLRHCYGRNPPDRVSSMPTRRLITFPALKLF